MAGGTLLRVLVGNGKHMFINMSIVNMVKMPIMEKVRMVLMLDLGVATSVMVNVVVRFMHVMVGHDWPPLFGYGVFL